MVQKTSMQLWYEYDKTGFPLILLNNFSMHLAPVTRVQFERFIRETDLFTELLQLNPPVSCDDLNTHNYERLFVTGINPEEALAFAEWLGGDFDLPTLDEWRQAYRHLQGTFIELPQPLCESASTMFNKLYELLPRIRYLRDSSLKHIGLELALMRDGVVEWVCHGNEYIGLGAPRNRFHPNTWNPLKDEIRPIHTGQRIHFFGFRLVRRTQ